MNFATFDLNLLRVLDAVLRERSTTMAGNRLGVSQSAVSNALGRLRHSLQDDLFIRQGNQLVPTDFAALLERPLREELDRLEGLLTKGHCFDPSNATGTFKIAGSDFFAELLMPGLSDILGQKSPKIVAQLVDLVPGRHLESLEKHQADLALIPDMEMPDWIEREPLFHSTFSVIGRKSNPALAGIKTGSELPMEIYCDLSHIAFSPEGKLAAMGDAALAKTGRRRRVAMTLPVFSGVCRAVSESDRVALVPTPLAHKVAKGFDLKVFDPPFEIHAAPIVGIWHKRSSGNPMANWVRQQVFELLKPLNDA